MTPEQKLKGQALSILVALVIQYLLGMAVNIYVQFPDSQSEGQLWEFAWHQPFLVAHIIVALLLFLGSLSFVVRVYKMKNLAWKAPVWIGFLAILLAGFAGSRFIPTQNDPYSYLMAICFLIAFGAYAWGMYQTK